MRVLVGVLTSLVLAGSGLPATADPAACAWTLVGSDTFRLPAGLTRSQGVTTDGKGWIFSWQGGLERTDDTYLTQAVGTLPPDLAVQPQVDPDGTNHVGGNHVGGNHIGDVDYYDGKVYAPVEDGGQNVEVTTLNDPEYQHPYIALYDAKTLAYTGVHYALDKGIHEAGVPWVAVDSRRRQVYTAEWEMPHDRLNVFDLQMRFERFLPLVYPADLGPNFHLSRIQGAKVDGRTMYATRDDDRKTVFSIDLRTGEVRRLFSLDPGVPAELEGLAVRATPDGARLHVIIILHNDIDASADFTDIQAVLQHYAMPRPGCVNG